MSLHLDYFYGTEEKQYHFFRFPKLLLTDLRYKTIPTEAKVLYSLLLDRMTLSMRNGWLDEQGRVFLYFSLEEAMEQLNCGKDKAIRLFKALDVTTGIGLIERHKQGQGRPTKIYIKNFMPAGQQPPAQATPGQSVDTLRKQTVAAQRAHASSATATPPMPCKQAATEQHVYIPPLPAPHKQAAIPRKRAASARRRIPPTPSMLRAMVEQQATAEQSAVAPSASPVTAQPTFTSFTPPKQAVTSRKQAPSARCVPTPSVLQAQAMAEQSAVAPFASPVTAQPTFPSFTPPKQAVMSRKQAPSARCVPTSSVLQAQVLAEQSAVQTTLSQPVLPSFVPHTPEPATLSQQEGQKAGTTTQEELLRQIAENQKKNMALLLEKLGFLTSVNPQSGLR